MKSSLNLKDSRKCGYCKSDLTNHATSKFCSRKCSNRFNKVRIPIEERIFEKVDRNGPIPKHFPNLGRCWIFTGSSVKGYGLIGAGGANGGMLLTHRVVWEMINGKIPSGFWALHRCDNPPCCNPSHVYLGTMLENTEDKISRNRQCAAESVWCAKLKRSDIPKIIALRKSGLTQRVIASKFSVGQWQISKILSRKCWKSI